MGPQEQLLQVLLESREVGQFTTIFFFFFITNPNAIFCHKTEPKMSVSLYGVSYSGNCAQIL
jgi:hypothetical protein